MPKNGACNLGSINLSEFVNDPYTNKALFNLDLFKETVNLAIRALDEVIDYGYNYHALQSQREMAYNYRNIGLGIMGLGSMFFKLGIIYGSKESKDLSDKIMHEMFRTAVISSNELSKEKGTFPRYSDKVFNSTIIKNHFTKSEIEILKVNGLRNCSLLSVAPSGSIGTMLNITTGVEPAFRISYKRKTETLHKNTDVYYDVYIQEAEEYKQINHCKELPDWYISSEKIGYKDRIDMQSIIQNHIDTAVSSTINLPNNTTIEDVEELYLYAWEKGLKGITIFRDGCKRIGILTSNNDNIKNNKKSNELKRGNWKPKAKDTIYEERKITIGCGKLKLFIGWSNTEKTIQDLYVIRSGSGGCERNLQTSVIAMSGMLRLGGNLENIEKAIEGVGGCNSFATQRAKGKNLSKGMNCGTAILNEIKLFMKEKETEIVVEPTFVINSAEDKKIVVAILTKDELNYIKENGEVSFAMRFNKCPKCGEYLEHVGGCLQCASCGFTKCE